MGPSGHRIAAALHATQDSIKGWAYAEAPHARDSYLVFVLGLARSEAQVPTDVLIRGHAPPTLRAPPIPTLGRTAPCVAATRSLLRTRDAKRYAKRGAATQGWDRARATALDRPPPV